MAYTNSSLVKSVFGNKRVHAIRVTADAASGAVTTNLKVIEYFSIGHQSATTDGFRVFMNQNAASAACNGVFQVSGVTSGDVFIITAVGR